MNTIKIKGAIFDFDGTLVDSESLYTKALIHTASEMNALKDFDFKSLAGYQTDDIYDFLKNNGYYVPDNFFKEAEIYFHKIIFLITEFLNYNKEVLLLICVIR